MQYTVTVTGDGNTNNVVIDDVMQFEPGVLTFNPASLLIEGGATCETTATTLACKANSLGDGETIVLHYEATLNNEAYLESVKSNSGCWQVGQNNKNTVTYQAEGLTSQDTVEPMPWIDVASSIRKSGEVVDQQGNVRTIEWKATVNPECKGSLAGTPITDTLSLGAYKGDIAIVVKNAEGTEVDRRTVGAPPGTQFISDVPATDGNYCYEIRKMVLGLDRLDGSALIPRTSRTFT
ncbi:Cna protein B-type domain protein [Bifidobacterium gallicum DSM 20093 = LMG 11596]|uniref:Cna protein B-type domain protein n=1 Tax=Bifidobacterium gallicum DSM 20093 = LMG 11596 TaxID=561180 RepID=A0A087AG28_9BIFI|nr:Cna protein B-type domain protein [Bifidobacterium gallicum DSM 20093 = LMG 11596]